MKYFGLAAAALVLTASAHAGQIVELCGVFGASAGGGFFTAPTSPTLTPAGPATCTGFTALGAGLTFSNVQLVLTADYTGGLGGTNNTQVTAFTGVTTDSLTSNGVGTSQFYSDTINGSPNDTCGGGGIPGFCGSNFYLDPTSITSGTYTANFTEGYSTSVTTGSVQGVSGQIYAVLNYSSTAPEPGSMMLLGGGLLAAGLIGRKKLAARK